jgi:hypothetical protein
MAALVQCSAVTFASRASSVRVVARSRNVVAAATVTRGASLPRGASTKMTVGTRVMMTSTDRGSSRANAVVTRASSSSSADGADDYVPWTDPSRLGLVALWLGLGSVAALVAPKGTTDFDMNLVTTLIGSPFSGAVNPIFESLFNSLGVVPAVYAALLLPGAKDQPRIPTVPPLAASFALGFFALGPYLITREPRTDPVSKSSLGWATRTIFESKIFAGFNALFATFLIGYGAVNFSADALEGFVTMWRDQSALACVSSCDLAVLSIAMYGAVSEDMKRRGCYDAGKAAAFCLVPVLGPCVYLVTRPSLPEN